MSRPKIEWSNERSITRRGVLWLGLRCDVRCKFCYDELVARSNKRWMPLADARLALDKFREYYDNRFVDFMGGEPTLHPNIVEIVAHSASIGLRPTIVTHGMHLARRARAEALAKAGLHDCLVSIHGVGEMARQIHGQGRDNFERQMRGLQNLTELGIPFRFNVTLIRDNIEQLPAIAELAVTLGARVVNFLTFNPYFEWEDEVKIPFQARHSEIAPNLMKAIDICDAGHVEANVRYMPLCQLPNYESHIHTGYQLPYDPHEWDYNSWYDCGHEGSPDRAWYMDASIRQQRRHRYQHADECAGCAAKGICDGFHAQYLARWGGSEARPFAGGPISNPTHFLTGSRKLGYEMADEEGSAGARERWTDLRLEFAAGGGSLGRKKESG